MRAYRVGKRPRTRDNPCILAVSRGCRIDIGLFVLLGVNVIVVAALGTALLGARVIHAPRWRRRASMPVHGI